MPWRVPGCSPVELDQMLMFERVYWYKFSLEDVLSLLNSSSLWFFPEHQDFAWDRKINIRNFKKYG